MAFVQQTLSNPLVLQYYTMDSNEYSPKTDYIHIEDEKEVLEMLRDAEESYQMLCSSLSTWRRHGVGEGKLDQESGDSACHYEGKMKNPIYDSHNISLDMNEGEIDKGYKDMLETQHELAQSIKYLKEVLSEIRQHKCAKQRGSFADSGAEKVQLDNNEFKTNIKKEIGKQKDLVSHVWSENMEHRLQKGGSKGKNVKCGIHPRNRYAMAEPNFSELGNLYPSLRPFLIPLVSEDEKIPVKPSFQIETERNTSAEFDFGKATRKRATIDFSNPVACRELTKVLLLHDFHISWNIPDGVLVPTLTNRINYLEWLQDLFTLEGPRDLSIKPTVLDVGCGANLIYPLLGSAILKWYFVGVDVSKTAIEWAEKNRIANPELAELIEIRQVPPTKQQIEFFSKNVKTVEGLLARTEPPSSANEFHDNFPVKRNQTDKEQGIISVALKPNESVTFTMCNPPFFESLEEAGSNPATAYGGSHLEMAYPGGELEFVRNMVKDSKTIWNRVHWFTTMVGKKSTMKKIRSELYDLTGDTWKDIIVRSTEFVQGKTMRWGLAWSFTASKETALRPLPRYSGIIFSNASIGLSSMTDCGHRTPEHISKKKSRVALQSCNMASRSFNWRIEIIKSKSSTAPMTILDLMHQTLSKNSRIVSCQKDTSSYKLQACLHPLPEDYRFEPSEKFPKLKESSNELSRHASNASNLSIQLLLQNSKELWLVVSLDKKPSQACIVAFDEIRANLWDALKRTEWNVSE